MNVIETLEKVIDVPVVKQVEVPQVLRNNVIGGALNTGACFFFFLGGCQRGGIRKGNTSKMKNCNVSQQKIWRRLRSEFI